MLPEPRQDVLVQRPLHHVMLLLHRPAGWPAWQVTLAAVVLAAAAGAAWWLVTTDGRLALSTAFLLLFFMAADAVVLRFLPARGISFGPWKSHVLVLALPRALAIVVSSLVGVWFDPRWGVAAAGVLQVAGSAALAWGAIIEPSRLILTHLTITSDRYPAGAPPLRILHVSDLHIERLTHREQMLLEVVETKRPDLILITGDYLNLSYVADPQARADACDLLAQLRAPLGVFATLGGPPVDVRHVAPGLFTGLSIHLLRHDWVRVNAGDGREVIVLGMDCSHDLAADAAWLGDLVARAPADAPQILLYHSPELMPQAARQGIDLYLCGHTHGGQVRLPLYGAVITSSQLGKRYEMGLYRDGRTHLYVSRGVGFEGLSAPRVRFLCRPEVALITLEGAA